jgi:peptidoglycan/xylan/chitin deacetylase (PgdA/CDA1 family)
VTEAATAPGPFRVALTFDAEHPDRPFEAGVTGRILDGLAAASVPAAFFLQGRWVESEPRLARRVAEDGHLVGNHSHHHARMTLLSRSGLRTDVLKAQRVIVGATGVDPRPWFRCPFGAGASSPRVLGGLAALGYRDVSWHVDSRDWGTTTARGLERRVVRMTTEAGDGAIVLMHGWPPSTAGALPAIIRRLADAGASFVRLDALPAFSQPAA